ncbi:MAG: T9SS type A sorting domain-containing protein [Bacteroidetes bacterium]|nr:T9SS type A sorting domain-containing protein [Bacteroidota bacterium]
MKKQTIKAAALALLLAATTSQKSHAQATVAWKQQFQGDAIHHWGENVTWLLSSFDTIAGQIYYQSSVTSKTGVDFNPDKNIKTLVKAGAANNYTFGENEHADAGTPVVSAYSTVSGQFKWVNKLEPISGFVLPDHLKEVGKSDGTYVGGRYKGKFKYKSTIFTSITKGNFASEDLFLLRLNSSGNLVSKAFIVPANPTDESKVVINSITTAKNGDLIVAISLEITENSSSHYIIKSSTYSKNITLKEKGVAIIRFDGSLKYLSHTIIETNGNSVAVDEMKTDASGNIVTKLSVYKSNNLAIDLNPSTAVDPIANNLVADQDGIFLVKYNPNLSGVVWKKQSMFKKYFKMQIDKMSNIYCISVVGSSDTAIISPTIKIIPAQGVSSQLVAKYDKNMNYVSHLATNRAAQYVDDFQVHMDGNNNIYMAYGLNVVSTSDWLYKRMFMSKIKTAGTMAEVWKNSIMNSINGYSVEGEGIYGHKNGVYATALLGPHANKYSVLVGNPLQTIKVSGNEYNSCIVKYTLSGAALSPEDQVEEGSNIAFKTGLEKTTLQVAVYPNPAADFVTIKVENTENTTATIYNYSGVTAKTITIEELETTVSISELPAGMYIVEIVSNGAKEIKKIVKQ